jgi:hypothetical protein
MGEKSPFRGLTPDAVESVGTDAVTTETLSVSTEMVDEIEIEHDGVWYDLDIRDGRPVLAERGEGE